MQQSQFAAALESWLNAVSRRALLAASLGWALDSFDVMLYALVIATLMRELSLSTTEAGLLGSVTLVASGIGGVVFGLIADRFGRRPAMLASILAYSVFTAACGLAQNVTQLAVFRFLLGLGMGGEWTSGAAIVSETWPDRHRGKAVALMQSSWAVGYALAALVAPATVRAAEPPVTFHTQPVSRVLDDLRAAADLVGGERAVKALNGSIREKFGEKGLTGLDAERPVFGYVSIAEKAEDIVAVVALPFTAEKEFLALYERAAGAAPKDLGKGVYEVFAEEKSKGLMRFSNRYAYIAIGAKPEGALDDKALVPANKVVDPAEPAIFTGKFHFDRLPPEVLKAVPRHIADFKKEIENNAGGLPIGQQELGVFKPLFEEMEKMVGRYTVLLAGTDTATLRVGLDVGSGDLSTEFALKGKPDSALSKAIAARKPTTNKFGALHVKVVTEDSVVYLLGIERGTIKADGLVDLRVNVKRSGATVRARRWVAP